MSEVLDREIDGLMAGRTDRQTRQTIGQRDGAVVVWWWRGQQRMKKNDKVAELSFPQGTSRD